jgi:Flp pilus assembly protein CpaB
MESIDRRGFFKQAGAAAAVVTIAGAVATVPLGMGSAIAGAATTHESELTTSEHLRDGEDLVAHVKNARTGEISLFVGEREVTIQDRKIAARLVRAIR